MTWSQRTVTILVTTVLLAFATSCKKEDSTAGGDEGTKTPEVPKEAKTEKSALNLGIVANAHAAPIVVGTTQGAFQKANLEVSPQVSPNYDAVLAGILDGSLDGGMLPPGLVLTAAAGQSQRLIVPCVLSRNGSTIVLSRSTWDLLTPDLLTTGQAAIMLPINADALSVVAQSAANRGKPLAFGVESAHSSANYLLRYWLAASGLYPGVTEGASQVAPSHPLLQYATVDIIAMTPPDIMAGLDDGLAGSAYCESSTRSNSHVTAITAHDILKNHPSTVLAVSADWAAQHPGTLQSLIQGLNEAAKWLDGSQENRRQAAQDMAKVIGADASALTEALTGSLLLADSVSVTSPDHLIFARYHATAPDATHALWTLTQIVRWGQVAGDRADDWYTDLVAQVYQMDLYEAALGTSYQGDSKITEFIDGQEFLAQSPNAYLKSSRIGLH